MGSINLIDPEGVPRAFDERDHAGIREAVAAGWSIESPEATASRTINARVKEDYSGTGDQIIAGGAALARGVTVGGSDVFLRAIGGPDAGYDLARLREANPGISTAGEIVGAVAPALLTGGESAIASAARLTPAGATARLGLGIARAGEEAGSITRVARGAAGAGVESAFQGFGQGLSDLALADDPLSVERIAGTLSHRTLFAAGVGTVTGGTLSGLEVGLGAARRRLTQASEAMAAGDNISADLAALDRKGLREAERAELDAIEAGRVPQRQQIADDLAAFREQAKADRPWDAVATGSKADALKAKKLGVRARKAEAEAAQLEEVAKTTGAADDIAAAETARAEAEAALEAAAAAGEAAAASKAPSWMRVYGKRALKADRQLDNLLDNPKALAAHPERARAALQQQEHVLEQIAAKVDELKVIHATDRTGRRAAALDMVVPTLERNRALQARLANVGAAPSSARLTAIGDALDAIGATSKKTLGESMAGGAAYGMTADLVRNIPVVGPLLAPLAGARVADAIAGKLGPQLVTATRQAAERATTAVNAFLTVTKSTQRVAPKLAPIVASKVLESTRFAPANDEAALPPSGKRKAAASVLEDSFDKRADELAAAVALDSMSGQAKVRPHVRAAIAERLSGLAAVAPHVADRLETHAVARLLFLHGKLPKRPMLGMKLLRPSEMEMRAFARYVAAADDPGGIEERLADGTITMEDVEVMQALYPERLATITAAILEGLPTLRAELPYHRRLALSLLTGVAVDPAMEPHILAALQAQYEEEPDTEGGTQAPQPKPAFGSVKKSIPNPTPAQLRAGGAHP